MKKTTSWCGFGRSAAGRWAAATLVVALGGFWLASAARGEEGAQAARAVRLSSVDGQVQLVKDGQPVADQAVANTPLFAGTRVGTADDGRAEIQFEDGSVARLSPNSALTLSVLHGPVGEGGEAEITLDNGLGYFELQGNGQAGTFRVKFGDSVVTATGFTVFRINTDTMPGEVAVFSGNAQIDRGGVTVDLHGGESVVLSAADPSRYTLTESIEPDSWDSWNSDRDQALNAEGADKTAATKGMPDANNPAWTDLDANGNWYNVPGTGYVWSPYDASNGGWDPYGYGNWMYTPGAGWGYISGYPWGYLPYQCGMWNWYNNFGWGWAPGIGGCNPWWNSGYGGYGLNLGILPVGYRVPVIPRMPHRVGPGKGYGPIPLIAVNRKPMGGAALPPRDRATPVTIAGAKVQPARPLSPRPTYERSASAYVNHTVPATSFAPGHSNAGPTFAPGRPAGSFAGGSYHPSSSSSASHSSSGGGFSSASHASSGGGGGGGGGGGHASGGGGGGGGGGGSHK